MDNQRGSNPAAAGRPAWWFKLRFVALVFSFIIGLCAYYARDKNSIAMGVNGIVQAVYFTVVTITTVGYGDCVPNTGISVCITVVLLLILANGAMSAVNTTIDWLLSKAAHRTGFYQWPNYVQIVSATILLLMLVIGIGIGAICRLENKKMDDGDVWYFNIISLMTVGYGDFSFESTGGQLFASFYLLIAPLLVARYIHFLNGSWLHWRIGPNLVEQQYHTRTTVGLERALKMARERSQRLQLVAENVQIKLANAANRIQNAQEQLWISLQSLENSRVEHEALVMALNVERALIENLVHQLQNARQENQGAAGEEGVAN